MFNKIKIHFSILIFIISSTSIYSQDNILLQYKSNNSLKYKTTYKFLKNDLSYSNLKPLLYPIANISLSRISYTPNPDNTLLAKYDLGNIDVSCCVFFNRALFTFPIKHEIRNTIDPTGRPVNSPDNSNKPIIIPCFFPNNSIRKDSEWDNTISVLEGKKSKTITIKYKLVDIVNNSDAVIKGSSSDDILIDGIFNYKNGYWYTFSMALKTESKNVIIRNYELVK